MADLIVDNNRPISVIDDDDDTNDEWPKSYPLGGAGSSTGGLMESQVNALLDPIKADITNIYKLFDFYLPITGGTMKGDIDMGGYLIKNMASEPETISGGTENE